MALSDAGDGPCGTGTWGWSQPLGGMARWGTSCLPAQHWASWGPWGQEAAPALHPRLGPAALVRVFARGGVRRERCGLEPAARQ